MFDLSYSVRNLSNGKEDFNLLYLFTFMNLNKHINQFHSTIDRQAGRAKNVKEPFIWYNLITS